MRHPRSMLRLAVAALAVLLPATAVPAADDSQDVSVSIVNNTTTPPAGKDKPPGWMSVSCGSGNHPVKKDTTLDITCTVENDEALSVSYRVNGGHGTSTVDCGVADGPEFDDESEVTLTFTGSGEGVTFTQSCTGVGDGLT